jgi:hypothetical protein
MLDPPAHIAHQDVIQLSDGDRQPLRRDRDTGAHRSLPPLPSPLLFTHPPPRKISAGWVVTGGRACGGASAPQPGGCASRSLSFASASASAAAAACEKARARP